MFFIVLQEETSLQENFDDMAEWYLSINRSCRFFFLLYI